MGKWWCANCKTTLHPTEVTFDEDCSHCGCNVEWIEDERILLERCKETIEDMMNIIGYKTYSKVDFKKWNGLIEEINKVLDM